MDFPGHFEQIFQQLNYQRVHGQLCDCVIVVGNRHFKAHRSVLAACSTHFRALFTVAEGDSSMNMIQLDSEVVTAEAFAALVEMMYSSTLMLGESNVMDVLLAASHLHLNNVVKACKHYLTTRTLPMSPTSDRAAHHHPQQDQQRHRQQQQQQQVPDLAMNQSLAASANLSTNAASSKLQRSFLLQQLGLSLVNSALSGVEEGGVGNVADGVIEQRASFPIRRFHKRKSSHALGLSEERSRQRQRTSAPNLGLLGEGGVNVERGEVTLHSPDSHKIGDDSKLDVAMTGLVNVPQDDPQMPSQSDSGHCEGESLRRIPGGGGVGKEEDVDEQDHQDGRAGAKMKLGTEDEEVEEEEQKVVVKREPLSSPEPTDEVSDVTSQAEGSDPAEPGGQEEEEKVELSPESSDRSFTSEPQPSSESLLQPTSQLLLKSSMSGAGSAGGGASFGCSNGLGGKLGFSISSFLSPKDFEHGSGLGSGEDDLPNTTTGDSVAHHFLMRQESARPSGSASSALLQSASLSGESRSKFGENLQAESVFLRPMQDGLGSPTGSVGGGGRGGLDQFGLDFQRSSLGLHALGRPARVPGDSTASSLTYSGYRRIAPKLSSGVQGEDGGSRVLQDAASSSSSLASPLLFNESGGYEMNSGRPTSLPPQLTRASADVLSKCKKALSEHNVLVVEGARKYACKICCKTFLTLTDCKKHIRVHTGEKPYACLKCGKRFSQSSHLYKHSKTTCLRWQNSNMSNSLL